MSIYHFDGELHEGALDHDVEMMVQNDVINVLDRVGIEQAEAIAAIRRVLKEIEKPR